MKSIKTLVRKVFGSCEKRGFDWSYRNGWTRCRFCGHYDLIEVSGRDWECLVCGAKGHDPVNPKEIRKAKQTGRIEQ